VQTTMTSHHTNNVLVVARTLSVQGRNILIRLHFMHYKFIAFKSEFLLTV